MGDGGVHASKRRYGVGTLLLAEVKERARHLGAAELGAAVVAPTDNWAEADTAREPGDFFLHRHGYRRYQSVIHFRLELDTDALLRAAALRQKRLAEAGRYTVDL